MRRPQLALTLACSACGAQPGAPCLRRDGQPAARNHVRRTPPAPCGSYGGYQRHVRAGEKACESCLDASRRYMADYRQANPDVRDRDIELLAARRRAIARLVDMHRADFDRLLADEVA